jgi:hypothetical protein
MVSVFFAGFTVDTCPLTVTSRITADTGARKRQRVRTAINAPQTNDFFIMILPQKR